jgi:hypothetical protein
MIRLRVGYCRKEGRADYGSEGSDASLEIELDSSTLDDPAGLRTKIQSLQRVCRRAVDDELSGDRQPEPAPEPEPAPQPRPQPQQPPQPPQNRNGYQGSSGGGYNGRSNGPPPQQRSGGGGGGNQNRQGPPANGRQLLGWAGKKTQEIGWNMTTSLGNWGKDAGVGSKITEWDEETVARGYAAALDWLAAPVPS